MRKLLAIAVFAATAVFAGDVAGKWSGQVNRPDGTKETDVVLQLEQDGDAVKGRVGTHGDDTIPIEKAKLDNNKLTFEVITSDAKFNVTLEVDGDTLKGGVIRLRDGQASPALPMELKRSSR